MTNRVGAILLVAAAAFALGSSIHAVALMSGWEHTRAAATEDVIAATLAFGLVAT